MRKREREGRRERSLAGVDTEQDDSQTQTKRERLYLEIGRDNFMTGRASDQRPAWERPSCCEASLVCKRFFPRNTFSASSVACRVAGRYRR